MTPTNLTSYIRHCFEVVEVGVNPDTRFNGIPLKPAPRESGLAPNANAKPLEEITADVIVNYTGKINAGSRNRTGTDRKARGILSPLRLPVPPFRQLGGGFRI